MKKTLMYPLMVIIASSCYGVLSTIIKVAMNHGFTSEEAVTSQYMIGCGLAFLLFILTQRQLPRLNKSGWITVIGAGLFTGTTGIVYGQSLNYLPASLAVVMLFQFTWIGLFLDCALKKRMPTRTELVSLLFLFSGTILAAGVLDVDLSGIAWQGWAFGLAAACSFACFVQFNSRPAEGITTTARVMVMSLVALTLISIFLTPEIAWNGRLFGDGLWVYGVALGVLGILLPIYLFSIAVPKVGGALASILSAMELPVAITVSVLVLNEAITVLQIFGIVIVLIGMMLPTLLSLRKQQRAQPQ
ncbi:MAG TPA: DMT family transporter [Metalysinibacillus jejuensis]|uniref:DMT family transporter n=1 Tax=Metalysinibacillus jejuensis TaxID=914327 RepID=A0A921T4A5_9BACL|nr:DMT family transporter [Metalysinibacillus jejuensis]HJH10413.1 DMT family transporter [Metalysinibacillus jejuensis]